MEFSDVVQIVLHIVGGPPGIFLVSLVSNSIPFVSIPYLGIVAGYSMVYRDPLGKLVLILSSASVAAVGKILVYFLGVAVSKGISETTRKNVELFRKVARKSLFVAIVLFASTPLPDDILYIPLGLMKYPLIPYFIAILLGKIVLTSVVVMYASWITEAAITNLFTVPIFIAVTIALTYIVLKVDWYEIINTLYSEGPIKASILFFKESWRVLTTPFRKN